MRASARGGASALLWTGHGARRESPAALLASKTHGAVGAGQPPNAAIMAVSTTVLLALLPCHSRKPSSGRRRR